MHITSWTESFISLYAFGFWQFLSSVGRNLTIDEEKEGSSFIGYSSSHQSLSCPCRAVQQDPSGRLRKEGTTQSRAKRNISFKNGNNLVLLVDGFANLCVYVCGTLTPIALNSPGCLRGSSTISLIWASCFLQPPMSS